MNYFLSKYKIYIGIGFLLAGRLGLPSLTAQPLTSDQIQTLSYQAGLDFMPDYLEFVSLPSDAHYPEQLEPNLQWLEQAFGERGFSTQRLSTEGIPVLLAEWTAENPTETVLFYMHVDGQPVDSSKWLQPNPYIPVLKVQNASGDWEIQDRTEIFTEIDPEWRIFGRAAADDKGPISMFLAAWDVIQKTKAYPNYTIKVFLDPEEEIGSPHLLKALEIHAEKLKAQHLVIMDGPMHASNAPTLTFGARGIASLSLTVLGPMGAQHSGHFGNYVPNPAVRLARLIASMKDDEGRVTIPGFYQGIQLDASTKAQLAAVPEDEAALKKNGWA